MADIQKVITANALNQGAAIVGIQRADATINKLDAPQISVLRDVDGTESIGVVESGYDTRFDDYGLRRKTLEMGDWNMDSTETISVTHSLGNNQWQGTRSVELVIRNDDDTTYYDGDRAGENVFVSGVAATTVLLARKTGGSFDGTDFDATGYNRGWVTIWYE